MKKFLTPAITCLFVTLSFAQVGLGPPHPVLPPQPGRGPHKRSRPCASWMPCNGGDPMPEFRAGKFRATVREGGYPVIVDLYQEQFGTPSSGVHNLSHRELKDLAYVIERASHCARGMLPSDSSKSEMD